MAGCSRVEVLDSLRNTVSPYILEVRCTYCCRGCCDTIFWVCSVLRLGMSCCFVVSSCGCRCLMWVVLVRYPYGGCWWLAGVPLSVSWWSCPGYKDDMVCLMFWRVQLTWLWYWDVPLSFYIFFLRDVVGIDAYVCSLVLVVVSRFDGMDVGPRLGGWMISLGSFSVKL